MNNLFNRLFYICAVFLMLIPLLSCGGGDGGGAAGTGTLSIGLTDAPGDYQHVWVTIKEIQVNKAAAEEDDDSGWLPAFTIGETIDLKTLENGAIFYFGLANLETGHYNQMRLILGTEPEPVEPIGDLDIQHPHANYLVIVPESPEDDPIKELKVPSGFQTGIKIVKGFEIVNQGTTSLILDFDAKKSVVKAGNSGQWLLKPTIKVLETVENSIGDNAIGGSEGGVAVSAQIYTPEPSEPTDSPWDPMDEVTVEGTAESDGDGYYKIYLPPNTYNVVATKDGFIPECIEVQAEFFEELTEVDFGLEEVIESGSAEVTVSGLDAEALAHLSIRQHLANCEGLEEEEVMIEVKFLPNVGNGAQDSISLPAGDYQIVAWADEKDTLVIPLIVTDGDVITPEVIFP